MANSKGKQTQSQPGEERFITSGKGINVIKKGGSGGKPTGRTKKGGGR